MIKIQKLHESSSSANRDGILNIDIRLACVEW